MQSGFCVQQVTRKDANGRWQTIPIFPQREQTTSGHRVSVIIGKNGSGKSYLLAGIAATLSDERAAPDPFDRDTPFQVLGVHCAGTKQHALKLPDGQPFVGYDGVLPKRIICLSMNPFDKFPMPKRRSYIDAINSDWEMDSLSEERRYYYFGVRRSFGLPSIGYMAAEAAEKILTDWILERWNRQKLAYMLEFLDLAPELSISYEKRFPRSLVELAKHSPRQFSEELVKHIQKQQRYRRPGQEVYIESNLDKFREAIIALSEVGEGRKITFSIDLNNFYRPTWEGEIYPYIVALRNVGLMSVPAVSLVRQNLDKIDLHFASSGEISLFSIFICIASTISDNCIIIIDEPETSLHPEWQRKFIDLLLGAFSRYHGCHFILATHSPLVISDIPHKGAHITAITREAYSEFSASDLADQSPDYTLLKAFRVTTKNNYYLRQLIVKLIGLASKGKLKDDSFLEGIQALQDALPLIEDEDDMRPLMKDLIDASERFGKK